MMTKVERGEMPKVVTIGGWVHRLTALAAVLAMAAGCSSADTNNRLRSSYIGTPVESFFIKWGGPVSSYAMGKEGRAYLWFSGRDSGYKPGDRGTVDLIGNTAWWRGYRIQGYNPLLECRVEILTAPNGFIVDIRTHRGNRDWWDMQRCREVFGRVPRR